MSVKLCYYCGNVATTVDHVVPRHLLVRAEDFGLDLSSVMRARKLVVPACGECNSLIGGAVFRTLKERAEFCRERLRNKYRKFLKMPDWSEEEIEEMGRVAQQDIRSALLTKENIKARMSWRPAEVQVDSEAVYELFRDLLKARQA